MRGAFWRLLHLDFRLSGLVVAAFFDFLNTGEGSMHVVRGTFVVRDFAIVVKGGHPNAGKTLRHP